MDMTNKTLVENSDASTSDALRRFTSKYVWWKTHDEALLYPDRVIAQVMDIGDYDDILLMENLFGRDCLRDILKRAEAGWFRPQSWTFWHYRLGVVSPDEHVPALPERKTG
jgi:hypothetical protein